jgi:hypothetical protein
MTTISTPSNIVVTGNASDSSLGVTFTVVIGGGVPGAQFTSTKTIALTSTTPSFNQPVQITNPAATYNAQGNVTFNISIVGVFNPPFTTNAQFLASVFVVQIKTLLGVLVASSSSFFFGTTPTPTETVVCFQKGTQLLTPAGYKAVEQFQAGDMLTSAKDGTTTVPVKSMVQFIGKKEEGGALYVLPKGVLGKNKPLNDLYMSGDHAFKAGPVWKHMKCAAGGAKETDADNIEYYHIILDDYFAHTLVAEGVEVESCFEDKGDGILMSWACNESCCTPLKCEFKPVPPPAPSSGPPFTLLGNQKKKESTFMIWAYNKALKKNVPLTCTEISLPK